MAATEWSEQRVKAEGVFRPLRLCPASNVSRIPCSFPARVAQHAVCLICMLGATLACITPLGPPARSPQPCALLRIVSVALVLIAGRRSLAGLGALPSSAAPAAVLLGSCNSSDSSRCSSSTRSSHVRAVWRRSRMPAASRLPACVRLWRCVCASGLHPGRQSRHVRYATCIV